MESLTKVYGIPLGGKAQSISSTVPSIPLSGVRIPNRLDLESPRDLEGDELREREVQSQIKMKNLLQNRQEVLHRAANRKLEKDIVIITLVYCFHSSNIKHVRS